MADLELPPPVARLARELAAEGGRALVVGGWVRDRMLGLATGDLDLEVYGLEPARLKEFLSSRGSLHTVGEAFAVYKLKLDGAPELAPLDIALPRRESKSGRGHRGFLVEGDPTLSPAEAARRRDFTINAISFDPTTGELVDPAGGAADLVRRRLAVVDPTSFVDDSLRVLRAIQLAARFELTIDPATVVLCRGIALDDLPAERIWGEVEKWLAKSARPSLGWWAARELGVVEKLWPEIGALAGCEQEPEWHPEGDVFVHTGLVLDEAAKLAIDLPRGRKLTLLLAAIAHDFGKPATTRVVDGRIRSPGHEAAGVGPTRQWLERLGVQTLDGEPVRDLVLALVQHHLAPTHLWNAELHGQRASDGAIRRLAGKVDPDLLHRLATADTRGRPPAPPSPAADRLFERMRALEVERGAPAPFLLGRHLLELGVSPGPAMGELLREIYELQLDGAVGDLESAIEAAKARLAAQP